ncbi:hypothetical protein AB0469_31890 [Streptomyces sp. NPDC093801]|uniref:hypothetical protein n=1 Tax=Streptomyces sp. NPDC093801 TaxID=3155203 RepID=UPI00344F056F
MLTVHSPEPGFSGEVGGVSFTGGAATVDPQAPSARAALAYFRRCGYRVVDDAPTDASSPAAPAAAAADFDPSEHNVADVLAYLADADEDERARVLAAEEAGDARATILKKGQPSE